MTLMRSPAGEERDIKPAGVDALSRLGWKPVKKHEPETQDEGSKPASRPRRRKN